MTEEFNQEVMDSDSDTELSPLALAALQQFYQEKEIAVQLLDPEVGELTLCDNSTRDLSSDKDSSNKLFQLDMASAFPEDWQMSQFWYDEGTSMKLARKAISLATENEGPIACLCCPSVFRSIGASSNGLNLNAHLYEFDTRFRAFGRNYYFYDYNEPEKVPEHLLHSYPVIVADPPFLSNECLEKISKTILLLKKSDAKVILCTGSVMEEMADKLLGLKKSSFIPSHKNNLGNDFSCFTNFGFSQS